MAKVAKKDLFDFGGDFPLLDTSGDAYIGGTPGFNEAGGGAYDPLLDPNLPDGAYDPRLDPNLPGGAYDPRLDPGIPSPGNSYGGGGSYTPSGSTLQSIARMLTGGRGGDGSALGALGSLLPMLATLYGGIQQRNATQHATQQIQDSLANANTQIGSMLGGAQSFYQPYADAGKSALGQLSAMPQSNLAANFKPIGSGKGLNLAQIVKGS